MEGGGSACDRPMLSRRCLVSLATYNQGQGFGVPQPSGHSHQAPVDTQSQIVGPSQIGDLLEVVIHNTALDCSLFKVQIRLFAAFVDRQDPAHFESPQEVVAGFMGWQAGIVSNRSSFPCSRPDKFQTNSKIDPPFS